LTHSQVAAIIDASRFNETISTPDQCEWTIPSPQEITSNEYTLEPGKVTPANTLVGGPPPSVKRVFRACSIKHFEEQGVIGYHCVYPGSISGAGMFAQEGKVQIFMNIVYGLSGYTVKVPAFIANAVHVVKELNA
jgi:hypothetical protein